VRHFGVVGVTLNRTGCGQSVTFKAPNRYKYVIIRRKESPSNLILVVISELRRVDIQLSRCQWWGTFELAWIFHSFNLPMAASADLALRNKEEIAAERAHTIF
jgi:hypothetical protein